MGFDAFVIARRKQVPPYVSASYLHCHIEIKGEGGIGKYSHIPSLPHWLVSQMYQQSLETRKDLSEKLSKANKVSNVLFHIRHTLCIAFYFLDIFLQSP